MFCPYCNRQNKEDAVFCNYCRKALPSNKITQTANQTTQQTLSNQPIKKSKPRISGNAIRGIITVVAIIILVVIVVAIYYPGILGL